MQEDRPEGAPNPAYRVDVSLPATDSAKAYAVSTFRYGAVGARPKVYIQAGLHADEFPGMLVLRCLRELLDDAAARGRIRGEIVVVPQANPIGLEQYGDGFLLGRYDAQTGSNFNREYPDLAREIGARLEGRLGADSSANVATIRAAMEEALFEWSPSGTVDALRRTLMLQAFDADLVLDLHADNEALKHLYVGKTLWPDVLDLAAEIDARAVLLADVSGGSPFDEACSGPWWALARRYPDLPVPPACVAATLELGSNDDVDPHNARNDAAALYRVLERRGVVDGPTDGELPRLRCDATSLTAMEQVKSPVSGLVVYRLRLGDTVKAGDVVATIVDPVGESVDIEAMTDGLLFARHNQTYAWPGKIIGKIAGKTPLENRREGQLLSD
ncbi:succinylglutamate desuccinylase/aspartoacylase family protein [Burkholderia sp. BCC0397]|uniref:succinylglutamate desuccinylase/aspartoacylase family protein n=1 Tax=Burkholderia sp. BCC0397 TaxID=486876 RepID=UPI00158B048C|nr:succinylglutamate desuccinylase/aspartoacylase family protein [Burkholderia sp. BCC0397]